MRVDAYGEYVREKLRGGDLVEERGLVEAFNDGVWWVLIVSVLKESQAVS